MVEKTILSGTRIGVFGKGGSGKSTVVVLLARSLQERGYRVAVLDADSTNVGLPQALGIEQAPASLLEYFGGMVFSGGLVTCPVDDPRPLAASKISLDELPARYYALSPEGIILILAGKIGGQGPGAGCDGPIAKIARDFRILPDKRFVTLVDFKAGFEDTARGTITSLDWAIIVVDPTTASVELAGNMQDMVAGIMAGLLPATRHLDNPELVAIANRLYTDAAIKGVLFILSKVPNEETEAYLTGKLTQKGISPIGTIYEHPSIALSWLKGLPVESNENEEKIERIIADLEAVGAAHTSTPLRLNT